MERKSYYYTIALFATISSYYALHNNKSSAHVFTKPSTLNLLKQSYKSPNKSFLVKLDDKKFHLRFVKTNESYTNNRFAIKHGAEIIVKDGQDVEIKSSNLLKTNSLLSRVTRQNSVTRKDMSWEIKRSSSLRESFRRSFSTKNTTPKDQKIDVFVNNTDNFSIQINTTAKKNINKTIDISVNQQGTTITSTKTTEFNEKIIKSTKLINSHAANNNKTTILVERKNTTTNDTFNSSYDVGSGKFIYKLEKINFLIPQKTMEENKEFLKSNLFSVKTKYIKGDNYGETLRYDSKNPLKPQEIGPSYEVVKTIDNEFIRTKYRNADGVLVLKKIYEDGKVETKITGVNGNVISESISKNDSYTKIDFNNEREITNKYTFSTMFDGDKIEWIENPKIKVGIFTDRNGELSKKMFIYDNDTTVIEYPDGKKSFIAIPKSPSSNNL